MWDIDPAEIDRYLSGRPTREQESGAGSPRSSQGGRRGGTADQLSRLRRAVSGENEGNAAPRRQQDLQQTRQPQGSAAPTQRTQRGAAVDRDQISNSGMPSQAPQQPQAPSRRGAVRQQAAPQRRSQATYRKDPYVDEQELGYDDELYTDDPYIDANDEEWVDRPARRASMPKPQIRISKPNLPRVTVPTAITNAPLVNDTFSLALIGVAVLGLAIMAFTLSSRLSSVPDLVTTHVSASGALEDMRGKDVLWRIPLLATMLMLMNVVAAWFFSTIDRFAARFILAAGLLVQFVAWVALIRYLW